MRISSKLLLMVCLSALGILAVGAVGLSALKDNLLEDRKVKIRELALLGRQILEVEYQAAQKAGLSEAETLVRLKDLLRTLRYGNQDYFFALTPDGVLTVAPSPKLEGKNLLDAKDADGVYYVREAIAQAKKGGGFLYYRFPRPSNVDLAFPKIAYTVSFKSYDWTIGASLYVDDIDAIFREQIIRVGALIGFALLLVVGMGFVFRRSIVNPLTDMTSAMRKLAAGDTATAIPALGRKDEVGAIAETVQVFRENLVETARLRSEQDELKTQADAEKLELLRKMADDFEHGVRSSLNLLTQSADEMSQISQAMSATAGDTSQRAAKVAGAAQQASANVQTVAAATEELSTSVAEIGQQVARSTQIAARAVDDANSANVTVQGLSEAAQKIGDVVKLISDIASQTNLLALNATIEAARAGDAGKGFAVVANEVKSLASQTAKATEEISAQVAAMQSVTGEAVHAIRSIGGTIASINEIATTIASAVEEQGAATREIARNVQQAAQGTGEVSSSIDQVNRSTDETGNAAKRVLLSAESVNQQSAALRHGVDQFLSKIRTA